MHFATGEATILVGLDTSTVAKGPFQLQMLNGVDGSWGICEAFRGLGLGKSHDCKCVEEHCVRSLFVFTFGVVGA